MSSVFSSGSSNVNRSFLTRNDPELRKRQQCGLLIATIFIIAVVISVSVTIVHIYQVPSANEKPTTPPVNVNTPVATTSAPVVTSVRPTTIPTEAPTITGFQACNGDESLCDVPANQVLYATLHNAISSLEDGVTIVPNHALQLEKALQSGWRGLNFDIGKCSAFTDQPVRLVHGICSLGTRDPIEVFTNIQTFLEDKPNEVILMPVEIVNTLDGGAVSFAEIFAIMDQVPGFTSLLYQHPGSGAAWPTLRELIAANTRILFFLYNGETLCVDATNGCPPGFHDWFTYAAETAFSFSTVDDLILNVNASCAITRGAQGTRDFFGINYFTEIPSATICEEIHQATIIRQHVEACSALNAPLSPSLILVDYWNIGDVEEVVSLYNELLAGSTSQTRQLSANVTMNLIGTFSDTMNDTVKRTFLSSCSDFYEAQLTDASNIYCSDVVDQKIIPFARRRLQRHLQSESMLQVVVEVRGSYPSESNTLSLTSADLETPLEITATSFAQSLSKVSDFFFYIIDVITPGDEEEITDVPIMAPTQPKPITVAPSTSPPIFITSAPPSTTAPVKIQTKVPIASTKSPVVVTTIAPVVTATPQPLLCNGHANLCDRAVNDILFATVHNAASTRADGVLIFPNHDKSLEDALISGYRGINVDIGICGDTIRLVHGFCALGYREVVPTFSNIVTFLQENTNEVVIIPVQIDNDVGGTVTLQEIDNIIQLVPGMKDIMYNHPVDATSWPTLRELITANTRILFFVYNGERCYGADKTVSCPVGIHDWFQYAGESEFQFDTPDQLINDKPYACTITRGGSGMLDFYGVNVFTTIPTERNCEILNTQANLESHLSSCSSLTGQTIVNFLFVDCWDVGDVISFTNAYNAAL